MTQPPTQAEKLKIFLDERRRLRSPPEPTTLRDLARVEELLETSGRFAEQAHVTGSDPAAVYPKLPSSSPWAHQELPEPTINAAEMFAVEVCGEPHEVELAARVLAARKSSDQSGDAPQGMKPDSSNGPAVCEGVEPRTGPILSPEAHQFLTQVFRRRPLR